MRIALNEMPNACKNSSMVIKSNNIPMARFSDVVWQHYAIGIFFRPPRAQKGERMMVRIISARVTLALDSALLHYATSAYRL